MGRRDDQGPCTLPTDQHGVKPGVRWSRRLLRVLGAGLASLVVSAAALTVVSATAHASVIDPNSPVPVYELDISATLHGNSVLSFTVDLQHPPDDLWGIGSFRIGDGRVSD